MQIYINRGGVGMKKNYNFDVENTPEILEVGGKAESLIKLTKGGFNVPEGSVLTVEFFNEWIVELMKKIEDKFSMDSMWNDPEQFKTIANQLKEDAKYLICTENQKSIVYAILKSHGENNRYAVRSSSPEEDLSGASFAGGYETVLGVTKDNMFNAIKTAFISCLDERVFYYKHQNGFDTSTLRIAVIIQKQIASEASGVGFSLNPLNNCFDEVVINANSGLGESVVSGMVTPDEFVVNKNSSTIIEKSIGSKEQAIILDDKDGTKIVEGLKNEFSVTDQQVVALTKLITEVEAYYGFPVDIEWAFSDGKLYLLQSRPITTYIPLPEEMQTSSDENPILYMDVSLIKQGITTPLTVLGGDCIGITQSFMFEEMMGKDVMSDIKGGMATTRGGRMYMNVSSSAKFQGAQRFINTWKMVDASTVDLLNSVDLDSYLPSKLPNAMKGAMWGTIKNNIGVIFPIRRAMKDPEAYKEWYQTYEDNFVAFLDRVVEEDHSLLDAPNVILEEYMDLLSKMLPMTYAAEISRNGISKLLDKSFEDGHEKMQYLERSLPDNVTIDMGMAMFQLSQMSEIKNNDYAGFSKVLKSNSFSAKFEQKWTEYLKTFGCRTSNELDVGVPRMYENIKELFDQIKGMSEIDESFNPKSIYMKSQTQRTETYEEVLHTLPAGSRKKLDKLYNTLVKLGGKREALKYWYVRSLTTIREIIIKKSR